MSGIIYKCNDCDSLLTVYVEQEDVDSAQKTILVNPCGECLASAESSGQSAGYDDGYTEGQRDAKDDAKESEDE